MPEPEPPPPAERRPAAGTAAVLTAVVVWGATAIVVRNVDRIDGLVLGWHRVWIGASATVAVYYATGRRLTLATLRRAVPGGLAFGTDIVLFFSSLKLTTVANATVISALQPALVLLVAPRLFGEAVSARLVAWTGVAFAGVAVVVYGSTGAPIWSLGGDLLAVGALLAWTAYFVFSRQARDELGPFEYLTAMLVVAAVAMTPVALVFGGNLAPGGADQWLWICVLAVGSGGFGHLLMSWAHGHLDAAVMSLLTLAIPVVGVASAALFLDEGITWVQAGGMAVVLAALGVVAAGSTKPVAVPPPSEPAASTL